MALGASVSRKVEVSESADTTVDASPTATTVTGNLTSTFAIFRPVMVAGASRSPWSIVLRADAFRPDNTVDGAQRRYIVGSTWDLNPRTSITFDVQSLGFRNGLAGTASRTYFLHLVSNF